MPSIPEDELRASIRDLRVTYDNKIREANKARTLASQVTKRANAGMHFEHALTLLLRQYAAKERLEEVRYARRIMPEYENHLEMRELELTGRIKQLKEGM